MDSRDAERLERIEKKLDDMASRGGQPARWFGYEYKSKATLWGLPLVHIAQGINPETGAPRVARGIIAIGNVAVGVFALGGVAMGVFCFGGVGLGVFVFGGVALALGIGVGGMAVGYVALGGMAVGYYAVGGMAIGVHALGGNAQDPVLLNMIKELFPGFQGLRNKGFN